MILDIRYHYRSCGHDGIIHGGMLGTLLDEHLAYVVSKMGELNRFAYSELY
jgi:acyl-coenzyme A thioesterase PaaI-like protein